jgi:hypothetical protein
MTPLRGDLSAFMGRTINMQLCGAGPVIVECIISILEKSYRILPIYISLKELENTTGVRAQSIRMPFDSFTYLALLKRYCFKEIWRQGWNGHPTM